MRTNDKIQMTIEIITTTNKKRGELNDISDDINRYRQKYLSFCDIKWKKVMKGIRGENKRNEKEFLNSFFFVGSSRIVTIIKMELCMKNLTLNMLYSLFSFPCLEGTKGSKTFLMEFHTRLNLEIRLDRIFSCKKWKWEIHLA